MREKRSCSYCSNPGTTAVVTLIDRRVDQEFVLCTTHSTDVLQRIWGERLISAEENTLGADVLCDIRAIVENKESYDVLVLLREKCGNRQIAIPLWQPDRHALMLMLKKELLIRPHSHQVMARMIQQLGGSAKHGLIDFADRSTSPPIMHSKLVIQQHGGDVRVDMRTGDMLILAVILEIPFYINGNILDSASEWKSQGGRRKSDASN